MEKIDTQGMSGPSTEGCKDNIYHRDENGEPIYPSFSHETLTLIDMVGVLIIIFGLYLVNREKERV